MNIEQVIGAIDEALTRLQQAKALLTKEETRRRPGRPNGTGNKEKAGTLTKPLIRKRTGPSAEGRARIAAAQTARWAAARKAAKKAARAAAKKAAATKPL